MKITCRNIKPQKISRKQVVHASEYFCKKIMGTRLMNKLNIELTFLDIEELGLCAVDDDEKYPRYFTIYLKSGMDYKDILGTLAHELVHVKQYARRELVQFEVNRTHAKFNGKEFDVKKTEYWLQPHEIEANGLEVGLLTMYVKEFDIRDE